MLIGLAASSSGNIMLDYTTLHCEDSLMTSTEQQLCKQYPQLYSFLFMNVNKLFKQHCQQQFKHERWNCTNITLPLLGVTQPFLTLSKLFIYVFWSHALGTRPIVDFNGEQGGALAPCLKMKSENLKERLKYIYWYC